MITNDIKVLIEQLDEYGQEQPGFIRRNKGKLALAALAAAGGIGYASNPELANDIDDVGRAIIKPGVKALRHAGLIKDSLRSNAATDFLDKAVTATKYNERLKDANNAIATANK
jgi:hypothetical protein